jgi:outer membrane protein assembly factor BamB
MKLLASVVLISLVCFNADAQWSQIGANPKHTGSVPVAAQPLLHLLSDITYDPFVPQEQATEGGDLFVHYQVPLVDGDDVFMEFKSGQYTTRDHWETQIWSIHGLRWQNGALVDRWTAVSDWKPVPASGPAFFEPVFHAVLANGSVYMPASGGTLLQLDRNDGHVIKRINPFATIDPNTYVSGVPAADAAGNICYGAFALDATAPAEKDIKGAWLVRVKPDGSATSVPFATLVPNAPKGTDQCTTSFSIRTQPRPWPPTPTSIAPTAPCGSVRPGINAAPAIAADGTIYVAAKAHFNSGYGFVVAVNSDLTPKWSTSMRKIFGDGCGVLVPFGTASNACRAGAAIGVDPATNEPGSGGVADDSTSSPVALPDGSVLYGAYTNYNGARGHLIHFSSAGAMLANYDFGWDITPAVWEHDGTYSIVMKENFYAPPEAYYITQLDANLKKEWQFKSTNTQACGRGPDGNVTCIDEQPNGFEWCVNAPAIDIRGTVYANSEDGNLYAIAQGGTVEDKIFLQLALGAGYTPVSIGPDGRLYAQNAGHLFSVGGSRPRHRAVGR